MEEERLIERHGLAAARIDDGAMKDMTNGIDNLPSIGLAALSGAVRSASFAMFLPILYPTYLWDCWSTENDARKRIAQKAPQTTEDFAPSEGTLGVQQPVGKRG